jgi:hypothetical protein
MRAKPRHSHIVIAFKNAPQIAQISGANAAAFHGQHHALEAFLCLKIHSSVNALVAGLFRGASCRAAAQQFSVSVSSVVRWAQRFRKIGSVAAKPMGGQRHSRLAGREPNIAWSVGVSIQGRADLIFCHRHINEPAAIA